MNTFLISAAIVGTVHALAPDHWLPFVMIGKAKGWNARRLAVATLAAGIGHVGSSLVIALIGVQCGSSFLRLMHLEAVRGQFFSVLLIGFGLAYMIWGIKKVKADQLKQQAGERSVSFWILFAIVALGPCESLIPFIFGVMSQDPRQVILITAVFLIATVSTMVAAAQLAFGGISLKDLRLHRVSHTYAGVVIAVVGIFVYLLSI